LPLADIISRTDIISRSLFSRDRDRDGWSGWRVERQLIPTKGVATFGPPKSKRSERTIALDPATVDALRAHRDVQQLERDLAGPAYDDGDLVFCNELGRPINPELLSKSFAKHRKAAGIPTGPPAHVAPHGRHARSDGHAACPPARCSGSLGDDPKTVLSTYAHLLPHSDAMAAEVVASVLADKPSTNTADPDVIAR